MCPWRLDIIDLELDIWRLPTVSQIISKTLFRIRTTQLGCTGLKSFPSTSASGCLSATSIAQIPVPVPTSRTRLTSSFLSGAKKCLLFVTSITMWWSRSRRSCSFSSLGMKYAPSLYAWYRRPFSTGYAVTLEVRDCEYAESCSSMLPTAESVSNYKKLGQIGSSHYLRTNE